MAQPFFFSATEARMLQVLSTCWWVGVCLFARAHLPLWRVVRTKMFFLCLNSSCCIDPHFSISNMVKHSRIYYILIRFAYDWKIDTKMTTITSTFTNKCLGFSLKGLNKWLNSSESFLHCLMYIIQIYYYFTVLTITDDVITVFW